MKIILKTFIFLSAVVVVLAGCSTSKNTSSSRWWHAFNARYNTYYNGAQAYIDGSLEKENGNRDNFTELIPLYVVGNKSSRELGRGGFDRAIEKAEKAIAKHSIKKRPEWNKKRAKTARDVEWLSRREYNPFLWKAWMLMGRSQFHKGAFDEAAATFSYMSRIYKNQPAIYGKARAWLAKCYVEEGWLYDAEDVIRDMRRDSIDRHALKEWDYTLADYYIRANRLQEAVLYLRRVISHEMRRKQKAREWFLMGQIQAALGNNSEAYKCFGRVVRANPPYELEFNARIAQTEVTASAQARQMVNKLRRMAASDKNKDYLDQVYYAMGNIRLAGGDTLGAIAAYETGNEKATRNGIEKGVLLLKLGNIYWNRERFADARRCYGTAIGLLDKDRKDYAELDKRSKVLDELVPFTDAVQLQDSLQYLAKCSEAERNAAIDRVIEALKKKEKEERSKQAEQEAEQRQAQNAGQNNFGMPQPRKESRTGDGTWYFYNPTAVKQGKLAFQQQWGKRENIDNWQRINKTVVGSMTPEITDAQRDSIDQAEARRDSIEQRMDSVQNDPHQRAYYLEQIPFTSEQLEASNKILMDGLHHSGVIFKDRLDNLPLAEKALRRLNDNFPTYEQTDDVLYHLYLLYMRKNQPVTAETYLDKLKTNYPDSKWTTILSDPYFKENALLGTHIEDSLYAVTYEAFKQGRYVEVKGNTRISESRFPLGANRDKFMFIGALGKLNEGDADGCVNDMKAVVEKFPQSRISEIAGMIVNGVQAGKKLRNAKFDLGDVWSYRSDVLNDSDSIRQVKLSDERNIDFRFMLVYNPDSVSENKLLFEIARFNFTSFPVRNFDIEIESLGMLHRMQVSGFRNFDEALQYARRLSGVKAITELLHRSVRTVIISDRNLQLIGSAFSYKDYEEFYKQHFAPLNIEKRYLLNEPAEIASPREPESIARPEGEPTNDDRLSVPADEISVPPTDSNTFALPENDTISPATNNKLELQQEKPVTPPAGNSEIILDEPQPAPAPPTTPEPTEPADDPMIYFDDPTTPTDSPDKKKQTDSSVEDEYYDLDGF